MKIIVTKTEASYNKIIYIDNLLFICVLKLYDLKMYWSPLVLCYKNNIYVSLYYLFADEEIIFSTINDIVRFEYQ